MGDRAFGDGFIAKYKDTIINEQPEEMSQSNTDHETIQLIIQKENILLEEWNLKEYQSELNLKHWNELINSDTDLNQIFKTEIDDKQRFIKMVKQYTDSNTSETNNDNFGDKLIMTVSKNAYNLGIWDRYCELNKEGV